jgi:tRNA(fMet)-specific endonuclease VapC
MPGRLLLDTSFVVDLFHGDAAAKGRTADAEEVFLSTVALGELYYGAERSDRRSEVIAQVDVLAAAVTVLPCDQETSRIYGSIKQRLRSRGRPLPENDVWIAAVALQHDLALVTRDRHFLEIEGLTLERW